MTATTDVRSGQHPTCVVCSPTHPFGLRLSFTLNGEGIAAAQFDSDPAFTGYPGLLHGGVISSLLDGAMTNCLFLHGHVAVTARLSVRFRHPVQIGPPVVVRAWIADTSRAFFQMEAELVQGGVRKASAEGVFMPVQPRIETGG
jgi:acyl-coenzyme A thioesterase PaaI-like protein